MPDKFKPLDWRQALGAAVATLLGLFALSAIASAAIENGFAILPILQDLVAGYRAVLYPIYDAILLTLTIGITVQPEHRDALTLIFLAASAANTECGLRYRRFLPFELARTSFYLTTGAGEGATKHFGGELLRTMVFGRSSMGVLLRVAVILCAIAVALWWLIFILPNSTAVASISHASTILRFWLAAQLPLAIAIVLFAFGFTVRRIVEAAVAGDAGIPPPKQILYYDEEGEPVIAGSNHPDLVQLRKQLCRAYWTVSGVLLAPLVLALAVTVIFASIIFFMLSFWLRRSWQGGPSS